MRIIRRSPGGTALQVGVGSALGIGLMIGVWFPTAFVIIHAFGISLGSVLFGFAVAGLLVIGILLPLGPRIRKLAGWHPQGPFVQIQVLSASLGRFHQELRIRGEGHEVRVRTNARRATITTALRLAHQMPPESETIP